LAALAACWKNMSERVEEFSIVARRFCKWAEAEYPANSQSLKQALELLTELFLQGIRLADDVKEIEEDSPSVESANGQANKVYSRACNLPLKHYSEIFDPNVIPPDEPVIGHLADDISDIYQDIQYGLIYWMRVILTMLYGNGFLICGSIGAHTPHLQFVRFIGICKKMKHLNKATKRHSVIFSSILFHKK
jgi:hypothetical protein